MTHHSDYHELLQLALYEELSKEQKQDMQDHLAECESCRQEQLRLMQFHSVLQRRPHISEDEDLLRQARRELFHSLRHRHSRRLALWQRIPGWFGHPVPVGLACLWIGVFLGYLLFGASESAALFGDLEQFDSGETVVTNLRILEVREDSSVEIAFDAVRPVRLAGSAKDEQIQRVLTHALISGHNPGVRLQAIDMLGFGDLRMADREVRSALITVLKTDDNPAVRERALAALRQHRFGEKIKDALLYVLTHDENPKLRIEAINHLESASARGRDSDPELLDTLRDKARSDSNDYIRLRAQAFLQRTNLEQ